MPPTKIGELAQATLNNAEQLSQEFLDYSIAPWLQRIEGEIRLKLFSRDERDEYFAKFDADAVVRTDIDKRAAFYTAARTNGILSPNEIRALEDRPPRDGGDTFENPNTTPGAPKPHV